MANVKYCDEFVCLCVCLSARIYPVPHARSLPFFVLVAYVRGSVLLRHVDDRECTSRSKCNLRLPCCGAILLLFFFKF